jgi:hypothetical protein
MPLGNDSTLMVMGMGRTDVARHVSTDITILPITSKICTDG